MDFLTLSLTQMTVARDAAGTAPSQDLRNNVCLHWGAGLPLDPKPLTLKYKPKP